MSTINNGGPAFPAHENWRIDSGMTLRDYFAAKALPSAITSCWKDVGYKPADGLTDIEQHARFAYQIADAMLKAREVKP